MIHVLPFILVVIALVALIFACLFSSHGECADRMENAAGLFEHDLTQWFRARRDFPRFYHGAGPKAADYGLDEATAAKIRERVRIDFERMK